MKQGAKYLGGFLLAAILLWLVLRGKNPAAIWAALGQASLLGLLLGAIVNLAHNLFRATRWRLILTPVRPRIPFRPLFSAVIIGYLTTWTVPGRLGELVRPALLAAREKLPLGPCLGSVLTDRLLDGAAIVFLFAAGTWLLPLEGEASEHAAQMRAATLVLLALVGVTLAVLVAASTARSGLGSWLEARTSGPLRWVGRTALSLVDGAEALRRPALLGPIVAQSVLAWLTIALGTWLGVRAAGAEVPFAAILILLPPLALGVALPTPGGAGGYHAAMSLGLIHLFGVPEAVAVSAGILMHLAVTVPVIVLGLILLKVDRLSWRDLLVAARQVRTLGAAPPVRECRVEGGR